MVSIFSNNKKIKIMKSKVLFLITAALLYAGVAVNAQEPFYPKPNTTSQIPFGKKLPAVSLSEEMQL